MQTQAIAHKHKHNKSNSPKAQTHVWPFRRRRLIQMQSHYAFDLLLLSALFSLSLSRTVIVIIFCYCYRCCYCIPFCLSDNTRASDTLATICCGWLWIRKRRQIAIRYTWQAFVVVLRICILCASLFNTFTKLLIRLIQTPLVLFFLWWCLFCFYLPYILCKTICSALFYNRRQFRVRQQQ